MSGWWFICWMLVGGLLGQEPTEPNIVQIPLTASGEVDIATVVGSLSGAKRVQLAEPPASVILPATGRSRSLTIQSLSDALQPGVAVDLTADSVLITVEPSSANEQGSPAWTQRLNALAERSRAEARRRGRYGFRTRPSYQPSDPTRPTICLIHGLNSTAAVFRHLAPALEAAGYGLVTYDFPYNRDLDETSADFSRDWPTFRQAQGDATRWVIVSHSMGALLARSYIEAARPDDPVEVAALLMIAPPHHGSHLAQGQTLLQTIQTLQSVRGERRTDPLAFLGDGLGAAADDLSPGSAYLTALNTRPRRAGVIYRAIAGDAAYLTREARSQLESSLATAGRFGGFGQLLTSGLSGQLDEITDGRGDGCVAVASTRLVGTPDPLVLHANHLELIRAPLLFPDPGPIAALPTLLEWLKEATGSDPKPPTR